MMKEEEYTGEDELLPEDGERQLYEHFRFVADRGQALLRVDKFLVLRIENALAGDDVALLHPVAVTNLKSSRKIYRSMSYMKMTT